MGRPTPLFGKVHTRVRTSMGPVGVVQSRSLPCLSLSSDLTPSLVQYLRRWLSPLPIQYPPDTVPLPWTQYLNLLNSRDWHRSIFDVKGRNKPRSTPVLWFKSGPAVYVFTTHTESSVRVSVRVDERLKGRINKDVRPFIFVDLTRVFLCYVCCLTGWSDLRIDGIFLFSGREGLDNGDLIMSSLLICGRIQSGDLWTQGHNGVEVNMGFVVCRSKTSNTCYVI